MRDIIVVDTETTSLAKDAAILEVAAVNLTTGEELYFVPHIPREELLDADPEALRINRYYERGVFRDELRDYETYESYRALHGMLRDNTLAGSNPTFDARLIARAPIALAIPMGEVWHHRLLDLSAYAAGVLGIEPAELPGLHTVCERLGVENDEEHSALSDARATAECFRRLMKIRGHFKPLPDLQNLFGAGSCRRSSDEPV